MGGGLCEFAKDCDARIVGGLFGLRIESKSKVSSPTEESEFVARSIVCGSVSPFFGVLECLGDFVTGLLCGIVDKVCGGLDDGCGDVDFLLL